jgi:hypothetical protein
VLERIRALKQKPAATCTGFVAVSCASSCAGARNRLEYSCLASVQIDKSKPIPHDLMDFLLKCDAAHDKMCCLQQPASRPLHCIWHRLYNHQYRLHLVRTHTK